MVFVLALGNDCYAVQARVEYYRDLDEYWIDQVDHKMLDNMYDGQYQHLLIYDDRLLFSYTQVDVNCFILSL